MQIQTPTQGLAQLPLRREILLIVSGIFLLALSARVQVPFWPVPMTLQTLTVLALGLTLGTRRGLSVVAGYLAVGAAGMPVFAGAAAGLATFAGPTGGFLVGMLAMVAIAGAGQGRSLTLRLTAGLVATLALYLCGLAWLSGFVPADRLIAAGLAPFALGDSVKIALAALAPAAFARR